MPVSVPTSTEFDSLSARVAKLENGGGPVPPTESADGTEVSTVGPAIVDAAGNRFTITTDKRIGINGLADPQTSNVVLMIYKDHSMTHQNQAGNFYKLTLSGTTSSYTQVSDPRVPPVPASGHYQITPGKITAPDGTPFRANGINCLYRRVWGGMGVDLARFSAASLKHAFPKLNFVRFADLYDYGINQGAHPATDATVHAWVNDLTSNGIIVEYDVHHTGNYASGQTLADDETMVTEWANVFKDNPRVWLGTQNEPHGDAPGISRMMRTLYNAWRKTGNANPVLFATGNPGGEITGMDPAQFADTDNTAFDPHYYGWMPSNGISWQNILDQCAAFHNKQGPMSSLCLETGDSTDGNTVDGNWQDVLNQSLNNPCGSAAWMANWTHGSGGDELLVSPFDFSQLTSYGVFVRDKMH
jgi:hypothetical protein